MADPERPADPGRPDERGDALARCKVRETGTLLDAMWALERGGTEIALIVDENDVLQAVLTDGDVRRALLAGAALSEPVAKHGKRGFTAVSPRTSRAEVLDLMRARTFGQIPIVDDAGRLVGLHRMSEVVGARVRDNWAVVMAGGKGTRLRPLTEQLPKPMIRVAGRPILERIVLHLVGSGIRRIFLSVNYLGHLIEEHFGDGSRFGCRIEYVREERPMGTGGSLSLLPEAPTAPLLVMNGDLVTEADVGAMLDFHASSMSGTGAARPRATLGVRRYHHVVPFGCLDLDGDRVVRMEEKPSLVRIVNAGLYVLDPEVVARVPRDEVGLPDLLEQCIARGETVRAYEIQSDWIDVGQREQLRLAREGSTPE